VKNTAIARRFLRKCLVGAVATGFILGILGATVIYTGIGPRKSLAENSEGRVSIEQHKGRYNFYKNSKPFLVKGGAGFSHIRELAEHGGNTAMCWDTSKLQNLFIEATLYKIDVIVGLDLPSSKEESFYNDKRKVDSLYSALSIVVMRYKNNPALFAWCLGNELSFPFSLTSTPFYDTYNRVLRMINTLDPNHPVSTTVINVPKRSIMNIRWRIPALDFISINSYNRLKTIREDIELLKWIWQGPYLLTEWAPNGGWEAERTIWQAPIENTSTKKAEQFVEFYNRYMPREDQRFLGSVAFYWGSRQEYTNTWYSVYAENGASTEVADALSDCWKDTITAHQAPKLRFMLVDSLGARDNIIISKGSDHVAEVLLDSAQATDSLRYSWQVVREDWLNWGRTWDHFKTPQVEKGLETGNDREKICFRAPVKKGPYRVFVTVYNSKGYCATANTPIYVED
jgi:hypothetical protein